MGTVQGSGDTANARGYESQLSIEDAQKIPPGYRMPLIVVPDNNGWTGIAMPFDVAGWGSTPEEAIRDTIALVEEYLCMGFREGKAFSQLFRKAPARYWIRMIAHGIREWFSGGKPTKRDGHRGSVNTEVALSACEPAIA